MNMVKKIHKAKDSGLKDGEQVLTALLKNDDGAILKAAVSGGVGGLIGLFAGSKMQKKTDAKAENDQLKESELSKTIPAGLGFIAVTDQRVLVYSHNAISGNAKELVAELPKGSLKIVDVQKGKLASRVIVQFSDGGRVAYDVPKMNDIDEFSAQL